MRAIVIFVNHGILQSIFTDHSKFLYGMEELLTSHVIGADCIAFERFDVYPDHLEVLHRHGAAVYQIQDYSIKTFKLDQLYPQFEDVEEKVMNSLVSMIQLNNWSYRDCRGDSNGN